MKKSWDIAIRRGIQVLFAGFIILRAIMHIRGVSGTVASIDALCPFGGAETFWSVVTAGRYIPKTHQSNLVLFGGVIVSVLLVGGAFCGWMCPMGTLSDGLSSLRRRVKIKEIKLGCAARTMMGLLRYAVLLGILIGTARVGKMIFADYDPYRTIFSLAWISKPSEIKATAVASTLFVLTGSFFVDRFWCRFLCPLGAIVSLLQPIAVLKIRRHESTCIDCGKCNRVCPVKLPVATRSTPGSTCTSCLDCVSICPVRDTLYVGTFGRRRPSKPAIEI